MSAPDSENPFSEIGQTPEERKSLPPPKSEIIRKIIAGFVFVVGVIVMVLGAVGFGRRGALPGFGICSVAYAVYDGRMLGWMGRRKPHGNQDRLD